jgi:hypothetical protein
MGLGTGYSPAKIRSSTRSTSSIAKRILAGLRAVRPGLITRGASQPAAIASRKTWVPSRSATSALEQILRKASLFMRRFLFIYEETDRGLDFLGETFAVSTGVRPEFTEISGFLDLDPFCRFSKFFVSHKERCRQLLYMFCVTIIITRL